MNFNTDFLVQRSRFQGEPTTNQKKITTHSSPVDSNYYNKYALKHNELICYLF